MTIARACRPPAQEECQRLAGRWWIAQHSPSSRRRCGWSGHQVPRRTTFGGEVSLRSPPLNGTRLGGGSTCMRLVTLTGFLTAVLARHSFRQLPVIRGEREFGSAERRRRVQATLT